MAQESTMLTGSKDIDPQEHQRGFLHQVAEANGVLHTPWLTSIGN